MFMCKFIRCPVETLQCNVSAIVINLWYSNKQVYFERNNRIIHQYPLVVPAHFLLLHVFQNGRLKL